MTINRFVQRPYVLEGKAAVANNLIKKSDNGDLQIFYNDNWITISLANQFDLTAATIFGLNERLTLTALSPLIDDSGLTLREKFNDEWMNYSQALENDDLLSYGYFVYYPEKKHLVHFCDPYWHKVVAVASSSTLLADPKFELKWKEIRQIFSSTVVGVAGCSVGSNIIHNIMMDMRPDNIKIADKVPYKMENINRVRLGYWDMVKSNVFRAGMMDVGLKNKAQVVADQIYSIDPFVNVYVYDEGLNRDNIEKFFEGDFSEPKLDIIVEEIDDPQSKLFIRQEAKKRHIPLIMASDMGSMVQIEVSRYDLNDELPLTYGVDDHDFVASVESVSQSGTDRKLFFQFVDTLIGADYRQDELSRIIEEKCEIPTSTIIPQLGSTAAASGAIVAELIARIRLGYQYPPRFSFNKKTLEVKIYQ
jgi:molybdopterin/thiamine biosynthesis adenylyltransferase